MSLVFSYVLIWLLGSVVALGLAYRKALMAAWREPVLRDPVLIFESDDWGYGPQVQATRLDRISDLLSEFSDRSGRHPVMTLGVVLAGPDTERIRASACTGYFRVRLADAALSPILHAMVRGIERGVFTAQLHGMEHYWPPALMRKAGSDLDVKNWLISPGFPATESLPPPLQSRWMDASELPSIPLRREDIDSAVGQEIREFRTCFGTSPKVVVPPTFAWTAEVQSAWARGGVEVVVSSGQRNPHRDEAGNLQSEDDLHFNGANDADGVVFVVRDDYFEPMRGHTHTEALATLDRKAFLGRPALLETHRSNFIAGEGEAEKAITEMRLLLDAAARRFPNLRFMSTEELAAHLRQGSDLLEQRVGARVHFLLRRLGEISRLRKLAWLTGAVLVVWFTYAATRPSPQAKTDFEKRA